MSGDQKQNTSTSGLPRRKTMNSFPKVEVAELICKTEFSSCLECPVCLDVPLPPVYLCAIGHIICGSCRKKVKSCGLCSQPFQGARNFFYETVFDKTLFHCRYATEGCKMTILGKILKVHHEECSFRPLPCVKYGCSSMKSGHLIPYSKFVEHFTSIHDGKINNCNGGKVCNGYPADADTWLVSRWVHEVFYYQGHYFFATCQIRKPEVGVWLWVLGDNELASKFRVIVRLGDSVKANGVSPKTPTSGNSNNKMKKVSWEWEGPVHSIRKAADVVMDSGDCLVTSIANVKSLCLNHDSRTYWEVTFEIVVKDNINGNVQHRLLQPYAHVTTRRMSLVSPYEFSSPN